MIGTLALVDYPLHRDYKQQIHKVARGIPILLFLMRTLEGSSACKGLQFVFVLGLASLCVLFDCQNVRLAFETVVMFPLGVVISAMGDEGNNMCERFC